MIGAYLPIRCDEFKDTPIVGGIAKRFANITFLTIGDTQIHIKNLKLDFKLEKVALATIRGGSCSGIVNCEDRHPTYPKLHSLDDDWLKIRTELMDYIKSTYLRALKCSSM